MPDKPMPLTKYYAIMIQPGDGGLGPREIRLATVWPEEEPNSIEKIEDPYGVIVLFSTFSCAEAYRQRDGRYGLSDGWVCYGMDPDLCRDLLSNHNGKATHVSLDPGEVLLTSQPIADFLIAMPYHTLDPDKE